MTRRVLVTGAGGQVGHEVCAVFEREGWDVTGLAHARLDIGDRGAVLAAHRAARPDVVVNAAAYTAVDACETETDTAWRSNALAVRYLTEAAADAGAHLCHISTDYVFSGDKIGPYVEWDETDPRSVYGRSKLGGEREAGPAATLVRTAWVCGDHGANMIKTILRLAAEPDRQLAFVDDQVGCLTVAADLAEAIFGLATERRPGLHHVTNQGALSWFEVAQRVLAAVGEDPGRVRPIATADLDPPRPAPRPANSVLDNAALRLAGLALPPPVEDSLPALVKRLTG